MGDACEEGLCGESSHLHQGLVDGGQAGDAEAGADDIVKADHGDVVRHADAGVVEGANGPEGCNVVEAEHGGEVVGAAEQFLDGIVANDGRPGVQFEVDAKVGKDLDLQLLCNGNDGTPAIIGVDVEVLSAYEGDAAVAKTLEVLEGEHGGFAVIECDVGDAFFGAVPGDRDDGEINFRRVGGTDEEEAIDGAFAQETGVLVDEVPASVVGGGEVEVIGRHQGFFDAAHDESEVAFAGLRNQNANGHAAASAQGAGEVVGAILKLGSGLEDAFAGLAWNAFGSGGIADDDRHGGCGQA